MTPQQQERYWRAYARQNAKYERYGAKLFHAALIESVRRGIEAGNPMEPDIIPIRRAYQRFFRYVGVEHRKWEQQQWAKRARQKSLIPAILAKDEDEDDRGESPRRAPGRTFPPRSAPPQPEATGLFARMSISFRNQQWLNRLMGLINGLDVASRIQAVTETTKKKIQQIIAQTSQEEVRTGRLASRILEKFQGKMGRKRAELIARTETTYVTNEAAKANAEETGLELVKIWIATLDNRTRDAHRAMHGKPPIDAHEKFTVGGRQMDKPGDPAGGPANVCNCRCVVAYLPKDDLDGFV